MTHLCGNESGEESGVTQRSDMTQLGSGNKISEMWTAKILLHEQRIWLAGHLACYGLGGAVQAQIKLS